MVSEQAERPASQRLQSSRPGLTGLPLALGPLQPKIAPPELKGMMDKKLSGKHARWVVDPPGLPLPPPAAPSPFLSAACSGGSTWLAAHAAALATGGS